MKYMTVKVTFTEKVLGTCPADPEIYRNFIASKAPDAASIEDEVAAIGVDEVVENGMTIFPRTPDGVPCIFKHQIAGFFKAACSSLKAAKGEKTLSSDLKAHKKIIDGNVFFDTRMYPIEINGEMGTLERSLRAETAQGPRVALAISETVPAGSSFTFTVSTLGDYMKYIKEWLNYGRLRGFLQWRNAGYGTFTWEVVKEWEEAF